MLCITRVDEGRFGAWCRWRCLRLVMLCTTRLDASTWVASMVNLFEALVWLYASELLFDSTFIMLACREGSQLSLVNLRTLFLMIGEYMLRVETCVIVVVHILRRVSDVVQSWNRNAICKCIPLERRDNKWCALDNSTGATVKRSRRFRRPNVCGFWDPNFHFCDHRMKKKGDWSWSFPRFVNIWILISICSSILQIAVHRVRYSLNQAVPTVELMMGNP